MQLLPAAIDTPRVIDRTSREATSPLGGDLCVCHPRPVNGYSALYAILKNLFDLQNPFRAARGEELGRCGEAPAGVEPASAVLQTAARPSGSGAMNAPALSTEGHVLARNRTWASTFAESCARPSHPEDVENQHVAEPPTRESNPALRLRGPPCVRHTRGESERVPSPGVEPGLRPSGGRVPSVTRRGHERSRRPGSNRHEPAYKAGASPFGHVGVEQGRKDLNPVREFWRLAALPGA